MVTFSTPEDSSKEHLRMTDCAENILKELELPFRKVELCSGDLGFHQKKPTILKFGYQDKINLEKSLHSNLVTFNQEE